MTASPARLEPIAWQPMRPKHFIAFAGRHFAPLTLNWRHNFAAEPAGQACPDIATIRKKLDPGKELLIALS